MTEEELTVALADEIVQYIQIADKKDLIAQARFIVESCDNPACNLCLNLKKYMRELI